MRKLSAGMVVAIAAVLVAAAVAVAAETYKVSGVLKPGNETPKPVGAAGAHGTFTGTYTENAKGAVLKWKLVFSGLTGAATGAHIHKGKPGAAGPVVVPLCGPCHSGQSGTAKISKAVVDAIEHHDAYVNVHTAKNAGGEIRAPIKVAEG
jgi:hypothetical protein